MAKDFPSFEAFAAYLRTRIPAAVAAERLGFDAAGNMMAKAGRTMVGQEQEGWAALKDDTVARKQAAGQTGRISATDPLYAKGELRDSFRYTVGQAGFIWGSTDPVMPFHEHGTMHMAPRPIVGPVMFKHGREAVDLVVNHIMGAVAGRSEGTPLKAQDVSPPE